MKRIVALLVLIAMVIPVVVYSAALPFTPAIVLSRPTTTTMRIQLSGLRATGIDTIKVYSAVADSATGPKYWFKAAVTKDTTVTGLTPGATYIFKVRADSAGTYKTSVPDTLAMYKPQPEVAIPANIKDDFRKMSDATAWPGSNMYDYTFSLSASTSDSSMIYDVWPYTGMQFTPNVADSVNVKVRVMGGFTEGDVLYFVPVDSLTITTLGQKVVTWVIPVGCKQYYLQVIGQTGCKHAFSAAIRQRRYRY